MCCGENITYPIVKEDEEKIEIIYSDKKPVSVEDDEGVKLYYSKDGEIVKIIVPKDEEHHIIYLQ